jgi:hypothetical protein
MCGEVDIFWKGSIIDLREFSVIGGKLCPDLENGGEFVVFPKASVLVLWMGRKAVSLLSI